VNVHGEITRGISHTNIGNALHVCGMAVAGLPRGGARPAALGFFWGAHADSEQGACDADFGCPVLGLSAAAASTRQRS